ncbi:Clp protease N-terminal domain-containing protein [Lentzea tibetensis]|uniref:Clp protease N-terminal domain-containing protein n=1 Tax=Lentzea tibetensis TaxID=2591470 RepID=UPI0038B35CC5
MTPRQLSQQSSWWCPACVQRVPLLTSRPDGVGLIAWRTSPKRSSNLRASRAKGILERGLRESVSRKHSCVGTEHLLLGLLAGGEGTANRVLATLSVTHLRQTLLERMVP